MIILILIIGVILRLINLNQSLWLDEAISALASRDFSYLGITFDFLKIDNHPPLFYLLLRLWGQIFGFVDSVLRILSVVIGVSLIFVVYKISFRISKNNNLAILCASLISMSPLLIYYSQEVRMYILITLLAAIQIWVFLSILVASKLWKWILFSLMLCLLFFSDYITVFLFPVFLLYPVIRKDKNLLFKILVSFVPLTILFIFWFPTFNEQLIKNKEIVSSLPGWQFIVGGATIKNLAVAWMKFILGRISFEPKIIYYSLVVIGSTPIIFGLYLAVKNIKKDLLIWLWFIVPISLGFLFSFIIPVFNYFRFIYALPPILILSAIGIFKLKNELVKKSLIILILITNIFGLTIYYLDPSQSRENWKQAVSYIENNSTPEDLVVFEFYDPVAPFKWYSTNKVDAIGATNSYFADNVKTPKKLAPKLIGKTRIYHFEYLRDLTDPQKIVEQELQNEGFKKAEVLNDFKNIGQISIWNR